MSKAVAIKSYQDYQLIEENVKKYIEEYGVKYKFTEPGIGFMFFILERMFNLQEDECSENITDTSFVTRQPGYDNGSDKPHDKGIDAIIIDTEKKIVDLMNFKYYSRDFEKSKDKSFESGEITKVTDTLRNIFERTIPSNSNPILKEKLKEIFQHQDKGIRFEFKIHFVSNLYNPFTEDEDKEFKRHLTEHYGSNVKREFILIPNMIDKLINKQEEISAQFKVDGKNFFDKIAFGGKALITEINARDLIRIVLDDEAIRNNINATDDDIKDSIINENAFEDNVRVYLKQRSNINKNIKNTALKEEEADKFFFYNNGVTITCDKYEYQSTRNPLVSLSGIQVVNGSQTIHSLKEAFDEDSEFFDDISLLSRIYETGNSEFKSKIAEFTNNQNPVNNRDVRSIDITQIKLEQALKLKGYFYERKRNQFAEEDKVLRIDSEKFGQAFVAYKLQKPGEAKNKKSIIFSTEYSNIFNDKINADTVLEVFNLYNAIEEKKQELKATKPFLAHATYYIMYFISIMEDKNLVIMENYNKAIAYVEHIRDLEKSKLGDDYLDGVFFKSNIPKQYLSALETRFKTKFVTVS